MKLFESKVDPCNGSRLISIISLDNGRSLLGLHWGYICVFFRIFYTEYKLVDSSKLHDLDSCDLSDMTMRKFSDFMESKLSFKDKLKFIWIPYIKNIFVRSYSNKLSIQRLMKEYGKKGESLTNRI